MAIVLEIYCQTLLLVRIYLAPPFQVQLLYDLLVTLAPYLHLPVLLMGDYNAILDPELDSTNVSRPASVDLSTWAAVAGLTELWRWGHPDATSYSQLSLTHKSLARIDLAFGNASIFKYHYDSEYLAGGLSDHNPLLVTLAFPFRGEERGMETGTRLVTGGTGGRSSPDCCGYLLGYQCRLG